MPTSSQGSRYTASNIFCLLLLGTLRELGYDVEPFMKKLGLRLSELLLPEGRMPLADLHAAWRAAEQLTGDDAFGVTVASRVDPQANMSWPAPFSFHEHVGRASATTRDAIVRQGRMMRLLRDAHSVTLEGPNEQPTVRFEFPVADEPRSLMHFHMGAGLLFTRRIIADLEGKGPLEVRFAHPPPKNLATFEKFFDAPLRFDAGEYSFLVDGSLIDVPLPTANPMMLSIFELRARQAIDALPALDDFASEVRERIESELPEGNTNASFVAEKLGISQRTLHRRLQADGTSYQELLDKVRCKLAQRLLASRKHTINEVAQLVGFAQPSAFHRAFKSWTNETPADYQERFASAKSIPPSSSRR